MASLIKKITGGRERVTLIGKNSSGEVVEVELDLVETFDVVYTNKINYHTVEKKPSSVVGMVLDYVKPENPVITSSCILSDSVLKKIPAKDKLKQIIYWQRTGTILSLEGYTVGSSGLGKIANFFKRGTGNFQSDLDEPFYAGIVTDEIPNLVLGNINVKNLPNLGNDIAVTLNFARVTLADTTNKSKGGKKAAPRKDPKEVKKDDKTIKSDAKKMKEVKK